MNLSPIEGVGNAGCPLHPQPRVRSVESTRVFTTVAPEHPAFPHAMVLTAYFVLSPVTGPFCHRRRRIGGLSAPGRADMPSANLTPASGRQDHTILPSAASISRQRAVDRSQAFRPALRSPRAQNAAASTASRPASVTIAIRPSVGRDGEGCRCDLGQAKTKIFLRTGLDRGNQNAEPFDPPCITWLADAAAPTASPRRIRREIVETGQDSAAPDFGRPHAQLGKKPEPSSPDER
jgi:hypothetical protein